MRSQLCLVMFLCAAALLLSAQTSAEASANAVPWQQEGAHLIGTPAPPWQGLEWMQGKPLSLEKLRGRVVLLRFWMMDCRYCKATIPAIEDLRTRYAPQGLSVVGVHHPITEKSGDPEVVARAIPELGLRGAVANDPYWTTLQAYGAKSTFKKFSSISFLIDQQGIIRWVHDGGEYHAGGGKGHEECNAAFAALEAKVQELLAEDRPRSSSP